MSKTSCDVSSWKWLRIKDVSAAITAACSTAAREAAAVTTATTVAFHSQHVNYKKMGTHCMLCADSHTHSC